MVNPTCDTAEMDLFPAAPAAQPGSVDPGALRRALKLGQKARVHFGAKSFLDAEADLRRLWARRGETAEWEWVRAAMRAGFEPESFTDE